MDRFPKLKTGAAAQYPADRMLSGATEVHRFLDSSEQRYRDRPPGGRSWKIRLTLLDDAEIGALREFFVRQRGRAGLFEFEDPWSGAVVPNCRFASDAWLFRASGEFRNESEIEIVEAA